jgi:hypothetical protein
LIRIRTQVGDKRVSTLFHNGKWHTLVSGGGGGEADSLLEAGRNHLQAALQLREQTKGTSNE